MVRLRESYHFLHYLGVIWQNKVMSYNIRIFPPNSRHFHDRTSTLLIDDDKDSSIFSECLNIHVKNGFALKLCWYRLNYSIRPVVSCGLIKKCLWHLPLSVYTVCSVALVPQGAALGWWLIAPFRGAFVRTIIADGHCRCAGTLHPDFKSGERDFVK